MAAVLTAQVLAKEKLLDHVVRVDFEMVDPPEIRYEAGQYIILHTAERDGKVIKRSYSIASPPNPKGFSLCVKVVGLASQYISNLNPGDRVKFSGPWGLGKFTFPEKTEAEIVMMATGTGFSPIHGLLQSRVPAHPEKKFLFLWGLARESDIYNTAVLDDLATRHPHFSYRIILSEPDVSWQGKRGMLSRVFADEIGEAPGKEYFLAGNGAMIASVESQLKAREVMAAKIHKEVFFMPPAVS